MPENHDLQIAWLLLGTGGIGLLAIGVAIIASLIIDKKEKKK